MYTGYTFHDWSKLSEVSKVYPKCTISKQLFFNKHQSADINF